MALLYLLGEFSSLHYQSRSLGCSHALALAADVLRTDEVELAVFNLDDFCGIGIVCDGRE